jgi:hypothetical protein
VGAGDARVSALRFQHVLVDECTQASEPEALIPLVLGAKQVRNVKTCRLAIAHVPLSYASFDTFAWQMACSLAAGLQGTGSKF